MWKNTGIGLVAAALALGLSAPLAAHENHDALGAGPGPAVTQPAPVQAGPAAAEMANMHENMAGAHDMAADQHEAAADQNRTLRQRLVSWLGRLHTLVIHFPIAMFVGALGVELFGIRRRTTAYRPAAQTMLVVGAIGAVTAAILGWFAGGFYLTDRNQILMLHRWLGTLIAIAGIVLVYLASNARRTPERPRKTYWVALVLMTIAIAVQGYIGGSFMHGGMSHLAF